MKLDSPVVTSTCRACGLYLTAVHTLSQLRLDILAGMNAILKRLCVSYA